jgi:hypothetical protein
MDNDLEKILTSSAELIAKNTCDLAEVRLLPETPENKKKIDTLENTRKTLIDNITIIEKLMNAPTDAEVDKRLNAAIDKINSLAATHGVITGDRTLILSKGENNSLSLSARIVPTSVHNSAEHNKPSPHKPGKK